jgi:long-chain acyl-CoA synthetase
MPTHAESAIVTPARRVDRHALSERAAHVRTELTRTVSPGTRLGIWVDDPVDFTVGAMAALAAGVEAFVIPAQTTPARVAELCAMEGSSAVLCDRTRATRMPPGPQHGCGPDLVLAGSPVEPVPNVDGADAECEQGALHFFTSGTDGRPKGVVRSHGSLLLEEEIVGRHLGMAPGRAVLCAVPVTHGYGYTAGLSAPLSFGGTSVVAQPRLAASLAKLLTEHEPEIVVAVPAQYAAWSLLRRPYAGPRPRLWLCGGAPLPPAVRQRFQDIWGGSIAEQYGMTETGAATVDLDGTETLGRPYPGVIVSISGSESPSARGEVLIATPYGPNGYLDDRADGSAARFTAGGFRSGDTGWLDEHERLHLVGRRAHQLNVRGQKVDPTEVERALWTVEGIREVAVIGVDRMEGDQWIAAFVVCADTTTDDALHAATAGLESFKRPQRVTRLPELPKTATGTDAEALRALLLRPGSTGRA